MLSHCDANSTYLIIFQNVRHYLLSWLLLMINIAALTGGSLCICVIVKYNVFTRNTRSWFLSLIISDIIIVSVAANDFYFLLIFEDRYETFLLEYFYFFGCQVRFGLIVAVSWVCSALQTGLSLERTIHIILPIKARIIFTLKRTRLIIVALVLISGGSGLLVTAVTFEVTKLPNNKTICERKDLKMTKAVYLIDLIVFRGVTFGIMTVTTIILVIFLRRRRMTHHVNCHRRSRIVSEYRKKTQSNQESKMFILLIVMNVITLTTNPLFLLFELIDGERTENIEFAKMTGDRCLSTILSIFFNELMYVNNLTNWIFYINVGSKFRSRLKQFICVNVQRLCKRDIEYVDSVPCQDMDEWVGKSLKHSTYHSVTINR